MAENKLTPPKDTAPQAVIRTDSISQIMEASFLRYSMSVIVSRALPDVREWLKPVPPADSVWYAQERLAQWWQDR